MSSTSMSNAKKIVEKAKQGFEKDLFAEDYAEVHSDKRHLTDLLRLCQIKRGKRYLDLGTGNGYIAFELAKQHPHIFVAGVDIVHKAVAANKRRAKLEGRGHLDFASYEGTVLPFGPSEFFGVLSRYAFHHFPDPALSASEIQRVLEAGGFFIMADPVPEVEDDVEFLNRFAALKDDGHVRFHSAADLESLYRCAGFRVDEQFSSSITFPRRLNGDYERLIERTPREILGAYQLRIEGDQVYLTVEVLNTRFVRS